MDIFGIALKNKLNGGKEDLYFEVYGDKFKHNLKRYFRKSSNLSKGEQKIISLCYGNILDIGCGTGNYIPELKKKGNVNAIDNSKEVIEVANKLGNFECVYADIFNFNNAKKYNSITLFENNIGLGGSPENTKKLLGIMKDLLNKGGQIIGTISKRVGNNDYYLAELIPIFNGIKGEQINWINLSFRYLESLCKGITGLEIEKISSNRYYTIYRIIKTTP